MNPSEVLDVTVLEPRMRHPAIFGRFDALPGDGSLVIVNDHDPKPLYYQLLAERGQTFRWEYLEKGPRVWRVQITREAGGASDLTVGKLLAEDFRRAEVFRKFGIDFCCGGRLTLREACDKVGVSEDAVRAELSRAGQSRGIESLRFQGWNVDLLCDYVEQNHHAYVRHAIQELGPHLENLASVHGDRHPETVMIRDLFGHVAAALSAHLSEEENSLFPYARALARAKKGESGLPDLHPSTRRIVEQHVGDHEQVGRWMGEIDRVSGHFAVPSDGCATYRMVYEGLREFWDDLMIHVHLENDVLFPKILTLEKELRN